MGLALCRKIGSHAECRCRLEWPEGFGLCSILSPGSLGSVSFLRVAEWLVTSVGLPVCIR